MKPDVTTHSFKRVGGNLSLDFTNTVSGWKFDFAQVADRRYGEAVIRDKLDGYADLAEWAKFVGLIAEPARQRLLQTAEQDPKTSAAVFRRALTLREALYRLFCARIGDKDLQQLDVNRLNAELSIARKHETLAAAERRLEWRWETSDGDLDQLLWPIARSAAELLTSLDMSRVRRCLGDECGWLFLDTSRNRSRHWCSMKDCGNLAKVRRFRQQQQGAN